MPEGPQRPATLATVLDVQPLTGIRAGLLPGPDRTSSTAGPGDRLDEGGLRALACVRPFLARWSWLRRGRDRREGGLPVCDGPRAHESASGRPQGGLVRLAEAHSRAPERANIAGAYGRSLPGGRRLPEAKEVLAPGLRGMQGSAPEALALPDRPATARASSPRPPPYYGNISSAAGANVEIMNLLGTCHFKMGNREEALKAWEKSLESIPTSIRCGSSSRLSRGIPPPLIGASGLSGRADRIAPNPRASGGGNPTLGNDGIIGAEHSKPRFFEISEESSSLQPLPSTALAGCAGAEPMVASNIRSLGGGGNFHRPASPGS